MEQTKQYEYVDLGLPSGLKWAKCNVGAEKETDYGDYFMWGSTIPNTADECNWVSYKYWNGSYNTLTKYNTSTLYGVNPDNITTLESVDDTATQIMGDDWKMPKMNDFIELLNGTTNEWITNFNGTGVNGMKFTSKTDTSKYIFIPAAGAYHIGSVFEEGGRGCVWSSSLNTSSPRHAYVLSFGSTDGYFISSAPYGYCFEGDSVRGVRK